MIQVLNTTFIVFFICYTGLNHANSELHSKNSSVQTDQGSLSSLNQSQMQKFQNLLITLLNFNIQPSRSLCKQYGLQKCGMGCCYQNKFFSKRTFQEKQQLFQQSNTEYETKKQICELKDRTMCGGICCKLEECQIDKNDYNMRANRSWCNYSEEDSCKNVGLLWCDGECCGFSSKNHKCFKTNHFGTAYIRCPIEDPVQQL